MKAFSCFGIRRTARSGFTCSQAWLVHSLRLVKFVTLRRPCADCFRRLARILGTARSVEFIWLLTTFSRAAGDITRAMAHLEQYERLQDRNHQLVSNATEALMAAEFDFSNQNSRIARLKAEKLERDILVTELHAEQSRLLLGGTLFLVVVSTGIISLYLVAMRRSRTIIRDANVRLRRNNSDLEHAISAKSQFLATMSHEIRTPLNGILGMTQVLLIRNDLSYLDHERVRLINTAGETMRILVDDLLDLAKMEYGSVTIRNTTVNLDHLIENVLDLWRGQALIKGLTFRKEIIGDIGCVELDHARLLQVLSNVLSNAVKFTISGEIVISAQVKEFGEERLHIAVIDSGIGIPEHDRERIFEKFTQLEEGLSRRFNGTGLGLAISRTITRAMGGDITVAEAPSGGSIFSIELPYVPSGARRPETIEMKSSAWPQLGYSPRGTLVLIVEPSVMRQAGYRTIMRSHDLNLIFCRDAHGAIESVRDGAVQVVLADTRTVTDGINELCEAARHADVPLILIHEGGTCHEPLPRHENVVFLPRADAADRLLDAVLAVATRVPRDLAVAV